MFDSCNRFLIKSHTDSALNADLSRLAVDPNDHAQDAGPLVLGLASFFGVFRVRRRDRPRSQDAPTNPKNAPADPAAAAFSYTRARALTNSTSRSGSNPSARPGAV